MLLTVTWPCSQVFTMAPSNPANPATQDLHRLSSLSTVSRAGGCLAGVGWRGNCCCYLPGACFSPAHHRSERQQPHGSTLAPASASSLSLKFELTNSLWGFDPQAPSLT